MHYYTREDLKVLATVSETTFNDFNAAIGADIYEDNQYVEIMDTVLEEHQDPTECLVEFLTLYVFDPSLKDSVEDFIFIKELRDLPLHINIESGVKYGDLHKTIISRWRLKIGK